MRARAAILTLFLAGCAATNPGHPRALSVAHPESVLATSASSAVPEPAQGYGAPYAPQRNKKPVWHEGRAVLQGWFGAGFLDAEQTGGGSVKTEETETLPILGGGAQWKLWGKNVDAGLEGLFSFGWKTNAAAFASGGGGAVIAVDVDLVVLDFFGGPFISKYVGERWRVYGAGGPLFSWVDYDSSGVGFEQDASGFGFGAYLRAGIEYMVSPSMLLGVGGRWSDVSVDLDNGLGDLDIDGSQFLITVTKGF